jgi:hypothetical protein
LHSQSYTLAQQALSQQQGATKPSSTVRPSQT